MIEQSSANEESLGIRPVAGWILCLLGLALLGWGWAYDATIPSAADLYGLGDRTFNLGLIVTKLSMLITGGSFFAAGCALIAGGASKGAGRSD